MEENKKRTLLIVSLVMVLALIFGISYAYFLAQDESGTQTITTQNIGLELDDGTEKEPVLLAEDIKPIDRDDIQTKAVKKNFTVTNTGDEKLFVEITLDDVVLGTDNALKRFDFLWSLYEVNGETEKNISIGSFETVEDTLTIGKYLVLEPDASKEYNLYIWIEETYLNQNAMMGQEFSAKIVATGEVYWETPASDFTFDETTGAITGYTGTATEISIPSVINGVAVTKITSGFSNKNLTNVIIPNSVTSIGENAFSNNKITNLVIPNSVTSIGSYAFMHNKISNLILSTNSTNFGEASFFENNIKSVVLSKNAKVNNMDTFASNNLTSLIVNFETVGQGSFQNNDIKNLVILDGVTKFDYDAFSGNNIESITIPNSVTTVNQGAFSGNPLTEVIIVGKSSLEEFTNGSGGLIVDGGLPSTAQIIFKP